MRRMYIGHMRTIDKVIIHLTKDRKLNSKIENISNAPSSAQKNKDHGQKVFNIMIQNLILRYKLYLESELWIENN